MVVEVEESTFVPDTLALIKNDNFADLNSALNLIGSGTNKYLLELKSSTVTFIALCKNLKREQVSEERNYC